MAILVTGSAGHLGEALMRTLRADGREAIGLDARASPWTDRVGSITDRAFVRDAMRGAHAVVHAATLHKPHLVTHTPQQFVDVNVSGTLALLEASVAAGVEAFVFTSTTSAFGAALAATPGEPATWITEDVAPIPKNMYGATKIAAEDLCELHHRRDGLPVVVLRTARFFPERDDDPERRAAFDPLNAQANELLYRRADIEDMASAHLCALERAGALGFGRYIVSATTPFSPADLPGLGRDAAAAVERLFPGSGAIYAARGWQLPSRLDRVYVNERARRELGWMPKHDFAHVLRSLEQGRDFRSALAGEVGVKGYHGEAFRDGLYPVA